MTDEILYLDPRELRLPSSRQSGADPLKLHRQIARYGSSADQMPPLWVYESADGFHVVYNGATRATRMAIHSPGTKVPVVVVGRLRRNYADGVTIGDLT